MDAVTPKAQKSAEQHSHVVRPANMEWQKTRFPGCEVKTLLFDRETGLVTALMRFAPGAVLPDHEHVKIEQTYVLEGKLVDKEGPGRRARGQARRIRLARDRQPPRRLDARGRADAGDVPDPEQVLRARRPRDRRRRARTGKASGAMRSRIERRHPSLPAHPISALPKPGTCADRVNVRAPALLERLHWAAWWNGRHSRLKICIPLLGVPVRVRARPPHTSASVD